MWDQTKIQDWFSLHPDYMVPAGDSAVGKVSLKERGTMKKKVKEQNGEFHVKVAEKPDEIKALQEIGFEYVCEKMGQCSSKSARSLKLSS